MYILFATTDVPHVLQVYAQRVDAEQQLKAAVRGWARSVGLIGADEQVRRLRAPSDKAAQPGELADQVGVWLEQTEYGWLLKRAVLQSSGWTLFDSPTLAWSRLAEVRLVGADQTLCGAELRALREAAAAARDELARLHQLANELEVQSQLHQLGAKSSAARLAELDQELQAAQRELQEQSLAWLVERVDLERAARRSEERAALRDAEITASDELYRTRCAELEAQRTQLQQKLEVTEALGAYELDEVRAAARDELHEAERRYQELCAREQQLEAAAARQQRQQQLEEQVAAFEALMTQDQLAGLERRLHEQEAARAALAERNLELEFDLSRTAERAERAERADAAEAECAALREHSLQLSCDMDSAAERAFAEIGELHERCDAQGQQLDELHERCEALAAERQLKADELALISERRDAQGELLAELYERCEALAAERQLKADELALLSGRCETQEQQLARTRAALAKEQEQCALHQRLLDLSQHALEKLSTDYGRACGELASTKEALQCGAEWIETLESIVEQRSDALSERARLQERCADLAMQLERQADLIAVGNSENNVLRAALDQVSTELDGKALLLNARNDWIASLERELDAQRERRDAAERELAAREGWASALAADEAAELRAQLQATEAANQQLRRRVEFDDQWIEQLTRSMQEQEDDAKFYRAEMEQLSGECQRYSEQLDHCEERADEAARLGDRLASAQQESAAALDVKQQRVRDLEAQVRRLERELASIADLEKELLQQSLQDWGRPPFSHDHLFQ
jgi:hypothetical protein